MRFRGRLPVAVALVVLVASLVPGGGGGGTLGPIGVDKLLHVAGYAVLAGTTLVALRERTLGVVLAVIVLVTGYGGVVELLQAPVPGRSVSLLDLVADAVGAVLGAVCWWLARAIDRGDGSPTE